MKIIHCKFSSGKYPVLVRADSSIPFFLPLTYTILSLKGKSYRTIINQITSIKILYLYFIEKEIDFEESILKGDFNTIVNKIPNLCAWIYNKDYKQISKRDILPISNQQFDIYITCIKSFLKWNAVRYRCKIDIIRIIEDSLSSYLIHNPSKTKSYRSLSKQEIDQIRELLLPLSNSNPFKEKVKLRNWVIFETLLQSGLRAGELLKLKSTDIIKNGDSFYIRIINRLNDEEDTRHIAPSLKNRQSERIIALSKELYDLLEYYIKNLRRPRRKDKIIKIKHGYLFTSERGFPISQNTTARIFKIIEQTLKKHGRSLSVSLSAHTLRHSFAEQFLEYLIETRKMDMERAKDELREICGWTKSSVMPNYYTSRYVNKMANQHGMKANYYIFLLQIVIVILALFQPLEASIIGEC